MTTNADALHISGIAHVYVAPVGTPAPSNHATDPAGPWSEVGHTSYEDGITITPNMTSEVKKTHQAPGGVREYITDWYVELGATLEQIDAATLTLYFGATDDGNGNMVVPKAPTPIERAVYIRSIDGAVVLPIYVPRVSVRSSGEMTLAPGSFTDLPTTMRTLDHEAAEGLMTFLLASA